MSDRLTPVRSAQALALLAAIGSLTAGCAWQPYVVTRGIRHLTGNHTRFHPIVPLTASLTSYRVVEVMPLRNLLGASVPTATEQYLDDRLVDGLRTLTSSPQIVAVTETPRGAAEARAPTTEPTLRVEGFIDDLDGGSLPLRIAELGFNHVAVTVRIRLRDKATSQVVGAASFTTQDDRVTATANAAINNVANRIRAYVESGYAR